LEFHSNVPKLEDKRRWKNTGGWFVVCVTNQADNTCSPILTTVTLWTYSKHICSFLTMFVRGTTSNHWALCTFSSIFWTCLFLNGVDYLHHINDSHNHGVTTLSW